MAHGTPRLPPALGNRTGSIARSGTYIRIAIDAVERERAVSARMRQSHPRCRRDVVGMSSGRSHSMSAAATRPKPTQRPLSQARRHPTGVVHAPSTPGRSVGRAAPPVYSRWWPRVPADLRPHSGGPRPCRSQRGWGSATSPVVQIRPMPTPAPTYGVTRLDRGSSYWQDVLRREAADPVLGPLDLAVQLRKGVAGRARHRPSYADSRWNHPPRAQSPTEPVAGRQSPSDAGSRSVGCVFSRFNGVYPRFDVCGGASANY